MSKVQKTTELNSLSQLSHFKIKRMYGLRASISGHSADVRVMIPCNYPMNGGFVTGGRDNDAKLWFPAGSGPGYEMMTRFREHHGG